MEQSQQNIINFQEQIIQEHQYTIQKLNLQEKYHKSLIEALEDLVVMQQQKIQEHQNKIQILTLDITCKKEILDAIQRITTCSIEKY